MKPRRFDPAAEWIAGDALQAQLYAESVRRVAGIGQVDIAAILGRHKRTIGGGFRAEWTWNSDLLFEVLDQLGIEVVLRLKDAAKLDGALGMKSKRSGSSMAHTSQQRHDWSVPLGMVAFASEYIGAPIVLDVCANRSNRRAFHYIDAERDCRKGPWAEHIGQLEPAGAWCNPPFGRDNLDPILATFPVQARLGWMTAAFFPGRHSASWFERRVLGVADELLLLGSSRVHCWVAGKKSTQSSVESMIAVYFPPDHPRHRIAEGKGTQIVPVPLPDYLAKGWRLHKADRGSLTDFLPTNRPFNPERDLARLVQQFIQPSEPAV